MNPEVMRQVAFLVPALLFSSGAAAWMVAGICCGLAAPRARAAEGGRRVFNPWWVVMGLAFLAAAGAPAVAMFRDSLGVLLGRTVPVSAALVFAGVATAGLLGVLPRPDWSWARSPGRWAWSRVGIVALLMAGGVWQPAAVPVVLLAVAALVGVPLALWRDALPGDYSGAEQRRSVRILAVAIVSTAGAWGVFFLGRDVPVGGAMPLHHVVAGALVAGGGWYVVAGVWREYLRRSVPDRVRVQRVGVGLRTEVLLPVGLAVFWLVSTVLSMVAYKRMMEHITERAVMEVTNMAHAFRWNATAREVQDGRSGRENARRALRLFVDNSGEYLAAGVWMQTGGGPLFLDAHGVGADGEPVDPLALYPGREPDGRPPRFVWVGRDSFLRTALVSVPAPEFVEARRAWYFSVLIDGRGLALPLAMQTAWTVGLSVVATGFLLLGCVMLVRSLHAAELRAAREQAEAEAQARNQLVGVISHELRTPLQSILGFAELMAEESLPDSVARQARAIHAQGKLLLRMVQDILDYTAMDVGRARETMEPVVLEELWEDLAVMFNERAAAKGLEFRIRAAADLPPVVRTDRLRVLQLLINLIGNAVKFTREGFVHVDVHAGEVGEDESGRLVMLEIAVSDSGPGLSAAQARRAFEPFRKLRDDGTPGHAGVGLGLAICRQIVTRLGGSIDLHSQVGEGTVFQVKLPVEVVEAGADEVARWREARPERRVGRPLAGLAVLVVDDNPYIRELMREFVARAGARVTARPDGQSALAAIEEETFDVVLMDVRLPDLDGREVTRRIRERSGLPDEPWVVGISAGLSEREIDALFESGLNDFLVKPISMPGLVETLRMSPVAERVDAEAAAAVPSPELGAEARAAFFGEARAIVERIEGLARERKGDRVIAEAHYLANGCLTFGLEEGFRICRELETLGEMEDFTTVLLRTAELRGVIEVAARPAQS